MFAVCVSFALVIGVFTPSFHVYAIGTGSLPFVPNPQTPYAAQFITKCENQQWFMNAVESLLNVYSKSINTLASKTELDNVLSLGLFDSSVSGKIPAAIGELGNLRYLYLGKNSLNGAIPGELFLCTKLVEVDLSRNKFSGSVPAAFGSLLDLKVLLAWDNEFSGAIPATLGGLTKLENLDLSTNRLTGGIPAQLSNATTLKVLNLSDNPTLGGVVPPSLSSLANLHILMAWNCGLTGAIPDLLGSLANLEVLDISQNDLTGTIPSTFSGLTQLKEFAASDNQLNGALPTVVASMTTLEVLDLARNGFTGIIPAAYSALSKLKALDLDGNVLTGNIADIWGGMTDLALAWLRGNQFIGDIPTNLLARFQGGADVRVDSNYIHGANASLLLHNENNFINHTTTDYQVWLSMDTYSQSAKNSNFNVYAAFATRRNDDGTVTAKPKLPASAYEVVCTSTFTNPANPAEWFTITSDASGVYIKLLKDVPYAAPINFELRMLPYDSAGTYTYTTFTIGTEKAPAPPAPPPIPPVAPPGNPPANGGVIVPPNVDGTIVVAPSAIPSPVGHEPYVAGVTDTLFKPDEPMTRENIAAILYELSDSPDVRSAGVYGVYASINLIFRDVAAARPAAAAIAWALANDIMTGYDDRYFRPEHGLTRAEFACIIVRRQDFTPVNTDRFPDAKNHWANGHIGAITSHGLINAYPDGSFNPNALITRAEVVTVINALLGRVPTTEHVRHLKNPFADLTTAHWAYAQIIEATVEH
jgi:Leucine-rich repeat (LRR) protein